MEELVVLVFALLFSMTDTDVFVICSCLLPALLLFTGVVFGDEFVLHSDPKRVKP